MPLINSFIHLHFEFNTCPVYFSLILFIFFRMLLVHWRLSSPRNSPTCLQLLMNSASIHPSLLTEKLRPSLHSGGGTLDSWANPLTRWGKPPVYIISHYNLIRTGGLPHLSGWPHLPGVPHLHVNRPLTTFAILHHPHYIGFGYCLYSSVYSSWLGSQFIVFMSCYVLHILL